MSILYNGNYRIIDLQSWHTWWPWMPIRLTEGGYSKRGRVRWLYAVERRIDYEKTFNKEVGSMELGSGPPYTYVWEYRDIGERDAELGILRRGGDGIPVPTFANAYLKDNNK